MQSNRKDQHETLFGTINRMTMAESIELTLQSMRAYGPEHAHWAIAFSGGKDSSATVTLIAWALDKGLIERPQSLTVFYADTRLELLPLAHAAMGILDKLRQSGVNVRIVTAPLDKRFFVYMFGRGVPPPNNGTLRWCTPSLKVAPMAAAIAETLDGIDDTLLMITGVRLGESAVRDRRIEMSCSKGGAECGQGWYQQELPKSKGVRGKIATLAPLLHWRVCHVWDWLKVFAPAEEYGAWPTGGIADAYGGDEAEEISARTGCVGCPLTEKDQSLDIVLGYRHWNYLSPLKRLKPLYRELREPGNRLRKPGFDTLKDGSMAANPQRMGPLTFEARLMALDTVLDIQNTINAAAERENRPRIDLLNAEEEARIRELIDLKTWPEGWDGTEPRADVPLDRVFHGGFVQPLLF
jgi:DNA sulfur modification protein DndC